MTAVTHTAYDHHDLGGILSSILADIVKSMTRGQGQAQILCPAGSQLFIVASTRVEEIGEAVLIDDSVSGDVFKWQRPLIHNDVTTVSLYKNFLGKDMRSEILVPIHDGWGVLNVETPLLNAFREEDIATLTGYAQSIPDSLPDAVASLELGILLQIELEIEQTVKAEPSPDIYEKIYALICRKAQRLVGADHIQLLFLEDDREHLRIAYSSHPTGVRQVLINNSVSGEAVRARKNLNIADVGDHPEYQPTIPGMKSELVVVAREGQQISAVINAESSRAPFTKHHETLLTLFAQQAARTLRQLRLAISLQKMQAERRAAETILAVADVIGNKIHSIGPDIRLAELGLADARSQLTNPGDSILNSFAQIEGALDRLKTVSSRFKEELEEAGEVITLDLNQIVSESVAHIQNWYNIPHGVQFLPSLSYDHIYICASRYGVRKMVENLVRNAFEASGSGGKVSLTTRLSHEALHPEKTFAELEVGDTGVGMNKEVLPKIFEPGFSTKRDAPIKGTGFGLFWVKLFVDRFRGVINVESEVGRGTKFTVRFPVFRFNVENPAA